MISTQELRWDVEGIQSLTPQPEDPKRSLDPASEEDPDIKVDLIDGVDKRPLTKLRGLFMENPFNGFVRRKSSFSPLYKPDRIFTRSSAEPGPLRS